MEHQSQASQAVLLFFRYAAAAIVACIAASLVFIVSVVGVTGAGLPQIGFFIPVILTGFASVFAGAFCLPRQRQLAGSIVLVVFAVGFGLSQILGSKYEIWDVAMLFHSIFFSVGGTMAVAFFFIRQRKNQLIDRTNIAPAAKLGGPFDTTPSE